MKMVKILFVAAMLVAALGTIAVAGGEDICTEVGSQNDIVTVPPKSDVTYDVQPCNPAFKEVQQSAGKAGI